MRLENLSQLLKFSRLLRAYRKREYPYPANEQSVSRSLHHHHRSHPAYAIELEREIDIPHQVEKSH
jgi:hypothetical protein